MKKVVLKLSPKTFVRYILWGVLLPHKIYLLEVLGKGLGEEHFFRRVFTKKYSILIYVTRMNATWYKARSVKDVFFNKFNKKGGRTTWQNIFP